MRTPTASSRFLTRLIAGLAAGGVATLGAGLFGVAAANAAPAAPSAEGTIVAANAVGAIKDRYIVVLKDDARAGAAQDLAARVGGTVTAEYGAAVKGFTVTLSEKGAKRLAANPAVKSVEQDRTVAMAADSAPWGLDRIDQRALPLNATYTAPSAAANVTAYILDTGVRLTHTEFAGRAKSGYDFIDKDTDASDCQGHGTHVAGTVAGKTYGVAKQAKIVAVRVLDCNGSGSYSAIIAGVDWVTKNAVKPAVANMSLGGGASATLDTAVKNSIASGVTYAVAAGNENKDACTVSPARQPDAITVGATDATDARASYSNYGTCVDVFAPGSAVLSSTKASDTSSGKMSGTSMATPHVAGIAALYLAANPSWTPAQVRAAMVADATPNKVTDVKGSPNKLVYTGDIKATTPTTPTAPAPTTPAPTTPAPTTPKTTPAGTAVTVTVTTRTTIADRATVDSPLTVTNTAGNGSKTAQIKISIKHTDRGDLAIYLIAPDGAQYKLKSSTSGDDIANLDTTYTTDLSTKIRNGTWKLRVQDVFAGDTGAIESWSLTV